MEGQRCLMKEVLEDARMVTLQREGGAVLARMRREDHRFPQSEDYRYQRSAAVTVSVQVHMLNQQLFFLHCRDALESVTVLYNQVEEKLHTLVMRSNESLQHLDFLFRLRKMESQISTVQFLCCTGGISKTDVFSEVLNEVPFCAAGWEVVEFRGRTDAKGLTNSRLHGVC